MCLCVCESVGIHGSQKRMLDPLELVLKETVNHSGWVLGTQLWFSERAASVLPCKSSLQPRNSSWPLPRAPYLTTVSILCDILGLYDCWLSDFLASPDHAFLYRLGYRPPPAHCLYCLAFLYLPFPLLPFTSPFIFHLLPSLPSHLLYFFSSVKGWTLSPGHGKWSSTTESHLQTPQCGSLCKSSGYKYKTLGSI